MPVSRKRVSLAAGLALVASALLVTPAAPAQAVSSGLVISEVFGGNGPTSLYNQDFVELYNPTSAPIDVTGWSVQYKSAGGAAPTSKVDLNGVIPAGGHYLAGGAVSSCTPGPCTNTIPTPDASNGGMNLSGTTGVIFFARQNTLLTATQLGAKGDLRDQPAIIDLVGFGAGDTYENAATPTVLQAPAPSSTTAIRRTGGDTDDNSADFAVTSAGSPASPTNCDCTAPAGLKVTEVYAEGGTPGAAYAHDFVEIQNTGSAALSMSGLSLQYRAPGNTGPGVKLVDLAGSMAAGSFDVVQLGSGGSDGAAIPSPQYTEGTTDLSTAGGTVFLVKSTTAYDPGTGAVTTDQYRSDLVGWGSSNTFESAPASVDSLDATHSLQRGNGGVDSGDNRADFDVYGPSPDAQPAVPVVTIPAIQGEGSTTPLNNANVSTSGVVTAAFPNGSGNFNGFYLQTAGFHPATDATPNASDAIFVYTGSSTSFPTPSVGQHVTIASGKVSEFDGMTELTVTNPANLTARAATAAEAVVPRSVLPGSDCALPGTGCLTGAALAAEREKHEGELFQPTAPYTVSDVYDGTPWSQPGSQGFAMQGEFGLAANSTEPLMIPTEKIDQSDTAAIAARRAYNDAHMITLDDGADADYTSSSVEDVARFPWLTAEHSVRTGAAVTFVKPVVLDHRAGLWRLQPQTKIAPGTTGADQVSFGNTRAANVQPQEVGGDLKIATFNMLNYFNTLGEEWADADGAGGARTCSYYTDRLNNRITNDTCEQDAVDPVTGLDILLPGPRGAANEANFLRQEAKELEAINRMDADIMSLEEVENSIKLHDPALDGDRDADRDDALIRLVAELNAHWAASHPGEAERWAHVPSPRPQALPTVAEQDAIRSAFIYNPSTVDVVDRSRVLVNSAAFRNAREPLAQAFKAEGAPRDDAFAVIVNHFKSKSGPQAPATVNGDNVDSGDGAGYYNGDRKRQAQALVSFAEQFRSDKQLDAVFLTGDFNAYSQEDPVQAITGAGYTDLHPDDGATTYNFGGLAGSLDHIFANEAAMDMVTGEDVWEINANESVYYEYSRYNANLAELYAAGPFRSSDHNPEIVGVDVPTIVPEPARDVVQVLATNDFHGRILDDPGSSAAGAAALAGAVKQLRQENQNTVFAAAGDLIGASTFESFVANDKPTIDALNEAGLEVSAAGNHEFDQGYDDLVNRVMAPYDAETNPEGGALWEYIAGNVRFKETEHGHEAGDAALPETWYQEFPDGHTVGFVAAVTEDLPALVAGEGIQDIVVTDIVESVNRDAATLKGAGGCGETDGCDLVVMLVHEGAATTAKSAVTDDSAFGQVVEGASPEIDAIVSGHTHLAYNHKVEVPEWVADAERVVKARPVVSAGQYGANLNRLQFEFAPGTDELLRIRQTVLALKDYDEDPATKAIVDAAVAAAEGQGSKVLGKIEGPFQRALRLDTVNNSTVENRGGESTLGNLVAEIQRWKTGADIGFMNPGGLRADLIGVLGSDPRNVTFRQAADVQPFANTLVTMDLTGAEIKTILEQQWQRDADGNIPSRPFLRLGTSDGFTSTYDPTAPEGSHITGMWLDGEPIDLTTTYRVAATSFLASGTGDNFWGFADAANKQDTGKTDLQAVVDYMAANAAVEPLARDFSQHQTGVDFPALAPTTYEAGDTLAFDLASLSMTGAADSPDVQDSSVSVFLGETPLSEPFPVTTTLPTEPDDRAGTATVSVTVPEVPDGTTVFRVVGNQTGTEVLVPVSTEDGKLDSAVTGSSEPHAYDTPGAVEVSVDPAAATGTVTLRNGETSLGSVTLAEGRGTIAIPARSLSVGSHTLSLSYSGDEAHEASTGSVLVTVTKATPALATSASPDTVELGSGTSTVTVAVSGNGYVPTGSVQCVSAAGTTTGNLGADGHATCVVGPFASAGPQTIDVTYSGDDFTAAASDSTTVVVEKLTPTMAVETSPREIVVDRTQVKMVATVMADNDPVVGEVRVQRPGYDVVRRLEDGEAQFRLPEFDRPGDHSVTVTYLGNDRFKQVTQEITITVRRPRR